MPGWASASRAVWLATLLLASCATDPPRRPAPAAAEGAARAILEDATLRYPGPDAVDVPARPVDPIVPEYPASLRALGIEGEVEARVVVHADGSTGPARLVSSSDDAFTAAAREALRGARFHPARRAGRPVSSWVGLRLRFRLAE